MALSFLIQAFSDVPASDDWLSAGEKSVLAGLRFPKRRNDWRLGRWTAKRAVCAREGKDLSLMPFLEIRAAQDGAPEAFWKDKPSESTISISHSRSRSLCVAANRDYAVGCDLEWIEPREENFAVDYFTAEELSFASRAPVERITADNLIWSAKESVMKALREGLRLDTRSIVIRPEFEERSGWYRWTGQYLEASRLFYGWWRVSDGFIYTIASEPQIEEIRQL